MDLYNNTNPVFTQWAVTNKLLTERFVVLDIGVQGGEHPRWQFLGPYVEIHGFDPIEEVIGELNQRLGGLGERHYHHLALGNEDGIARFFVCAHKFNSSFYTSDPTAEPRTVEIRRLDSLYREGIVPRADYIKLDCEGFEPEILRGAREYLDICDLVCVTAETNFNVSPLFPHTHFQAINEIMAEHHLIVHDINDIRSPAPAYLAALREKNGGQDLQDDGSPLAIGRPGTCDILFCRDFGAERRNPDHFRHGDRLPREPSVDTLIKAMINFELHGLMDCAVDLATSFREQLRERMDVDRAIALLLTPAPHSRNTADVTLTLARHAAELAQREAHFANERKSWFGIDELDTQLRQARARADELDAQLQEERASLAGRLRSFVNGNSFLSRLKRLRLRLADPAAVASKARGNH